MGQDSKLQARAQLVAQKVRHYLITTMGVTASEANDEEFFRAFCLTLREEIMINWTATIRSMNESKPRTLYYLCMEYLPGRLLLNNIANLHSEDLILQVMKNLGKDFSSLAALEHDPALGNGGLGRLASCLLDSLATQQYPAMGYGLRYQYGIFEQEVWAGEQVERPETWLLNENPWEFRRDLHAVNIAYGGTITPRQNGKGEEVYDLADHEEVRALSYDLPIIGYRETPDFTVLSLRLWTTKESPRNFLLQRYNAGLLDQAAENTTLTDVLYPNDNHEMGKRIRLKQEYLLAAASIGDIFTNFHQQHQDIDLFADKVRIHLNDTHPALAIAELMHLLLYDHNLSWQEAFEVTKTCCNYTNHTVLKEALEQWNEQRVEELLPRQYKIIQRINEDFCKAIKEKFPKNEERLKRMAIIEGGQIKMAHLSIVASHRVNGVAALHSEILKKDIFKDFYQMFPERFVNVTNGVTQRRWLYLCNRPLAQFLNARIGRGWITDLKQIQKISQYAQDPQSQEEFLEIKRANKEAFSQFLCQSNPIRDRQGQVIGCTDPFGPEALFDIQIKRIHEYKRQLMNALHALILYQELRENPQSHEIQRMIVIGGKAAPGYRLAKSILSFVCLLSRLIDQDPQVRKKLRVVYYENYNASRAEKIIPAADLSEQISCAGQEASGTGNMKLAINGALTIGTEDGANIEMHQAITDQFWPFGFGADAQEIAELSKEGKYDPWDVYNSNTQVKGALDVIKDGALGQTQEEKKALVDIWKTLLEPKEGITDRYFVLYDLPSLIETQKKVEELFLQPKKWAEYAIQNMAHMYRFSSDESIANYAKLIWELLPSPVDEKHLNQVREEYSQHDQCRIF